MKAWSVCLVCIVTVLVIGALEAYALYLGYNGILLAGAVALIAGVPAVLITRKIVRNGVVKKGNGN